MNTGEIQWPPNALPGSTVEINHRKYRLNNHWNTEEYGYRFDQCRVSRIGELNMRFLSLSRDHCSCERPIYRLVTGDDR